jgi:hypothetical protein
MYPYKGAAAAWTAESFSNSMPSDYECLEQENNYFGQQQFFPRPFHGIHYEDQEEENPY